ncbi:hypothetical protein MHBO_000511 [Bonamia ostreae]|uniref:Uncharacterized protein n=1 Tax=Bonamia ostreae TaxID=126728 RepID=A0ABV2AFY3_9EUKA
MSSLNKSSSNFSDVSSFPSRKKLSLETRHSQNTKFSDFSSANLSSNLSQSNTLSLRTPSKNIRKKPSSNISKTPSVKPQFVVALSEYRNRYFWYCFL